MYIYEYYVNTTVIPNIKTKSNEARPITMTATAHCGNHASSVPVVAVTPLVGLGNTIVQKKHVVYKINKFQKRVFVYKSGINFTSIFTHQKLA